eukprot:COSAG01_NODE_5918_length_3955_cov_16.718102_5_plen_104_part_00
MCRVPRVRCGWGWGGGGGCLHACSEHEPAHASVQADDAAAFEALRGAVLGQVDIDDRKRYMRYVLAPLHRLQSYGWCVWPCAMSSSAGGGGGEEGGGGCAGPL